MPKATGGLGFRDLRSFNIAVLGKLIWCFFTELSTLVSWVFRAKYFPTAHLFDAKLRDKASYTWKDLKPGFFWNLGRASRVRMFADNWGGSQAIRFQGVYQDRLDPPMLCSEFMLSDSSAWDPGAFLAVLQPVDARVTLFVLISDSYPDRLIWGGHDSGIYYVRSGYFYLRRPFRPSCKPSPVWKVIAKLDVLFKVKIFAWRLGKEGLPTGSRIHTAGLDTGLCPFCRTFIETPLHAFRDCADAHEALLMADVIPSLVTSSVPGALPWVEEAASQLSRPVLHDHLSASCSTGPSAMTPALSPVVWSPSPVWFSVDWHNTRLIPQKPNLQSMLRYLLVSSLP
ncbi:hypothetical protein V6N12_073342 [Hibiscus sabdariffa]|uniref:Reverse transcriptase zinc-binding domain-containing protein n=1 Tax=Hibiscus sabdariffa TaxID=183260 RepID=A0ABR2AP70_9ROSI